MEKLEWCRYSMVKKLRIYVYSFDVIHELDRRTDRRTLHDSIDRACIASRGKTGDGSQHRLSALFASRCRRPENSSSAKSRHPSSCQDTDRVEDRGLSHLSSLLPH